MKVLFVSDSTTVSGAEIVLLGCVDGLGANGHAAHGFVRCTNQRLIEAFRSLDVRLTTTSAYSDQLIRTTANPLALFSFARSFQAVSHELCELIRTEKIDVIHSISYPASLYAAFAALRTGTPHIWHEHNIKRIHQVNRVIYRWVGDTCRWVIGPSDAVTNNLAAAGINPAHLRTVYNGIDLRRFRNPSTVRIDALRRELGLRDGEQAIGLFGQMLPYKGHRTLIEAAPRILTAHPSARFYLVGALENPPYQHELQTLIAERGLSDRIRFTGWRNDVQDIIRAMDVVVIATTTPEPAALMLMEAAAMERPVVATRTGGTAELIADEETGLLFQPGDAIQLAERVCWILGNRDLGRSLGERARKRVEREFDLERHLSVMFELYRQAASLPPGTFAPPYRNQAITVAAPRDRSPQFR
jgi:glycosyltransferase involved in cell wall biosynthesis